MRLYLSFIFIGAIAVILFLGGAPEQRHRQFPSPIPPSLPKPIIKVVEPEVVIPEVFIDQQLLDNHFQQGTVHLLADNRPLHHSDILAGVAHYLGQELSSLIWSTRDGKAAIMATKAVNRFFYFVNSYLIGFQPFKAKNNWLPLYTIAQRKTYQLDSVQYGDKEVWQNSAQAYANLRGDCEDHAILLADWLIAEGIEARVVIGTYNGSGHAWVVSFVDGNTFLLEATKKRVGKSWNHYPLASLASGYQPEFMFDREFFWVNNGNTQTSNYSGQQWVKTAKFHK